MMLIPPLPNHQTGIRKQRQTRRSRHQPKKIALPSDKALATLLQNGLEAPDERLIRVLSLSLSINRPSRPNQYSIIHSRETIARVHRFGDSDLIPAFEQLRVQESPGQQAAMTIPQAFALPSPDPSRSAASIVHEHILAHPRPSRIQMVVRQEYLFPPSGIRFVRLLMLAAQTTRAGKWQAPIGLLENKSDGDSERNDEMLMKG
ncbi:hypothetical protein Dda_3119 [Drechslerella dactyloides]|uniref:Uncharacterized protein n=1 Tax=Drechslerella dactyloides TaxID=74499 RepID=A0AAD6NL68_DREDA|nr:hypothetical protein Dda_3119 [Drechslerella dactyloides]